MKKIFLNIIRKPILLFLIAFMMISNETRSMSHDSLTEEEKEIHPVSVPSLAPHFSCEALNKKISERYLSSFIQSPHFYAYPLTRCSLESIFSDSLSCDSFVRSLAQIPSLNGIYAIDEPGIPSLLSEGSFHFKGQMQEDTIVYVHVYNHAVSRMYRWEQTTASHQIKNILSDYQNYPGKELGQKILHVYITLLDSDWEKPFRLAEIYGGDPYFFSEDLPEIGSKNGRSIVYFIPAFDQKKFPFLSDETYWTHASEQEKWLYILKHGFMHLDVPLPLRYTLFATVFDRLNFATWRSDKIRRHVDDVMNKRNSFCHTSDALKSGRAKRTELLLAYPTSFEGHLHHVWPEEYAIWMQRALSAGIDFYSYLRQYEEKISKNPSSQESLTLAYFREVFFQAKLDLIIDLASFWHALTFQSLNGMSIAHKNDRLS